jgi:hypothetical protein
VQATKLAWTTKPVYAAGEEAAGTEDTVLLHTIISTGDEF